MSSNYPPGVSGNEPEISGPDSEDQIKDAREIFCENEECADYDVYREEDVTVDQWTYGTTVYEEWKWSCAFCNHVTEFTKEYEVETDDPDRMHDEW